MKRNIMTLLLALALLAGAATLAAAGTGQASKLSDAAIFPNVGGAGSAKLIAYLEDQRPGYRASAALELGRRKDKLAMASLKDLLQDKVPFVQLDAAKALLALGDATGLKTLRGLVISSSTTPDTALIAARILAEHGDHTGESLAQSNIGSPYGLLRLQALDVLKLSKDDDVAYAAMQICLKDKLGMVRRVAMWDLGDKGGQRAIELLKPFLSARNTMDRCTAVTALGRTRLYDGIPLLLNVLESDSDGTVRTRADHELTKLTGQKFAVGRNWNAAWKSGTAAAGLAGQWRGWWEKNKSKYQPGGKSPAPLTKPVSDMR